MSYSPNLPVGTGWKSTLTLAFQTLRRIAFTVESDFTWKDFDPQINFNGMASSLLIVSRARYLKLGKLLFFGLDFQATLAAPLTSYVTVTLPATLSNNNSLSPFQVGSAQINNAVAGESDFWNGYGGTNVINIYRTGVVNYTAVASRWHVSGTVEII